MYIEKYKKISFKNIIRIVNLFILSNSAKIGPPISIILSYYKVKPIKFCDEFNQETKQKFLDKLPLKVTIYIYKDKNFKYIIEYPSISFLIKNLLKFNKKEKLSYLDIYKIVLIKNIDNSNLNIFTLIKIIISTIFSMKKEIILK